MACELLKYHICTSATGTPGSRAVPMAVHRLARVAFVVLRQTVDSHRPSMMKKAAYTAVASKSGGSTHACNARVPYPKSTTTRSDHQPARSGFRQPTALARTIDR